MRKEQNRREFIRDKRRSLKKAEKAFKELQFGCAVRKLFDGTSDFHRAVYQMRTALDTMDRITKPLR